jgi:hypothetical protein
MNKMIILSFILIQSAIGGFERTETGARAAGFGNAYIALAGEVSGVSYNPSGIARLQRGQVSCYYSPQPFGLSELAVASISAAIPLSVGTVGLSARRYGFELYREVSVTATYARIIADSYFGFNLHYDAVHIKNYGTAGTVGVDVGLIVPLMKKLHWGLAVRNINSPTIGTRKENLPRVFTSGVAYFPVPDLTLLLDIQKELSFAPSTRFGFEYWILNSIAIRSGVTEKPTQFSAGLGLKYQFIQFDYAVAMHQELGWTHSISLTIL